MFWSGRIKLAQFEAVLYSDDSFIGEHLTLGSYDVNTTGIQNDPTTPTLVVRGEQSFIEMPSLLNSETHKLGTEGDSTAYHEGPQWMRLPPSSPLDAGFVSLWWNPTRIRNHLRDDYMPLLK